ncbi:hypothetical protein [Miltoncostaea oceani]|uniref:hypothetical protein n=1 Tax=Miltoncostaea oceani TaxID=2843216 RepID=UPI001C3DC90D|nr:hypothetical protein [Miltoncostaea oceani]
MGGGDPSWGQGLTAAMRVETPMGRRGLTVSEPHTLAIDDGPSWLVRFDGEPELRWWRATGLRPSSED